jgi:predicted Zn finger-like uncharacterized protein
MLIRCERCGALFSLQDGVAASGARVEVQCGRCLAVFDATGVSKAPPVPPPPDPAPAPRRTWASRLLDAVRRRIRREAP